MKKSERVMGYLRVPDLKALVCEGPCEHVDCKANREEWADQCCAICGKEFKKGDAFYYMRGKEKDHFCFKCSCFYLDV